MVVDYVTLTWT